MTTPTDLGLALPSSIKDHLRALVAALEANLREHLVAVLVHGSAARGTYRDGSSDVDVVVVLQHPSRDQLEETANAFQIARAAAGIQAMLVTTSELPRLVQIFPLMWGEIRDTHILVAGHDPFLSIGRSDQFLRLRIEQELRDAQVRLRRALVDNAGSPEALAVVLVRKLRQIRHPLRAWLALEGVEAPADLGAVLEAAERSAGVPTSALRAPGRQPDEAHDALVGLIDVVLARLSPAGAGEGTTT